MFYSQIDKMQEEFDLKIKAKEQAIKNEYLKTFGDNTQNIMNKAWELLCAECKKDAHQFDNWEQVPKKVRDMYIELVK